MKTRDAVLAYQETQSVDATTKTIDLDIVDPVSALGFEFEAVGGTTSNINNPLYRCVTKIEIVDGSDVLASLSFEQMQALNFYKTGKQPLLQINEHASAGNTIGTALLFGRKLWDPEYAMDFTRFKNPQLKITWNLAAIRALSATTAWGTGTFKISAWAKIMEDAVAPAQFLMAKQIDSWTGATSGDRRKELPIDYVYRMAMLRMYLSGNDTQENISKIKLTCDTDKFIPLDRYTKQLDHEMAQLFGNVVVWKKAFASNNDSIWLPVNREPQVVIIKGGNAGLHNYDVGLNYCWSGLANVYVYTDAGAIYGTDQRLDCHIEGHALHATLPIPFGDMDRPETWFNPTGYKKVEFVLTEAAAAANSIVLEQVRPL